MDIVARAQERREILKQELARLETFLETAYELQAEFVSRPEDSTGPSNGPQQNRRFGRGGAGAETLRVVTEILKDRRQPMSTRELLPLVRARGVEVGGKDPLATLSARISQKGVVSLTQGKWWIIEGSAKLQQLEREAAGIPGKEQPAASPFSVSEGGRQYAAALAN